MGGGGRGVTALVLHLDCLKTVPIRRFAVLEVRLSLKILILIIKKTLNKERFTALFPFLWLPSVKR